MDQALTDLALLQAEARAALDRSRNDVTRFFAPKSGVAFVGSVDVSPAARQLHKRFGPDVRVCFVNPRGGDAGELPVFRSVAELPDYVDLVVVKVGPARVPQVVEECGRRGIRNVLIFSSGFAEIGPDGVAMERAVAESARHHGVRIIGPNTNDNTFEQFPLPPNHRGGLIALITQSGASGRPVVEGMSMGAGFRRWVTAGNELDLEAADFIDWFTADPEVRAIACYIEGFKNIPKLRQAFEDANRADIPVVMLKMGATERGARSATSHTGHLAGADAVIDGLLRQYAVTRVRDLDELLEFSNLFAKLPAGTGTNCAMYTVSGGTATLMAELAEQHGVAMPVLSEATQRALHEFLPHDLSVANPVDNGGIFVMTASLEQRVRAMELIVEDPAVDMLVVGLNAAFGLLTDRMCDALRQFAPRAKKPVVAVWASVQTTETGYADLVASGVPIFRSFRKCFAGLRAYADYQQARPRLRPRRLHIGPLTPRQEAALCRPGVISGADASALLGEAGIPLAQERLVQSSEQAAAAASAIGFPVAMKLVAPAFPHKSDLGLVKLGIADAAAAAATCDALIARARELDAEAVIEGVLVQEQVGAGVEMIIGLSQDAQCGPALTIGAGGIYAEILGDVAVRPLPVDEGDVRDMIAGLRVSRLLAGARGARPADTEALVRLALRVAALGLAGYPRLAELDLNPVIVQPHRAIAVDALVVVGPAP